MAVIDFDHHVFLQVVLEALELEMQDRRKLLKHHALLGILETVAFRVVFVIAFQHLGLNIVPEGLLQVEHAFYVELNIVEVLRTSRLVLHVDTAQEALHLTDKQAVNGAVRCRALHFDLQLFLEHTIELLDIVLQERVEGLPAEGFRQLGRSHRLMTRLKLIKHALERIGHAVCGNVILCWDLIHGTAEIIGKKEGLEQ